VVGQISPHLLDRFALRPRWEGEGSPGDHWADDLEEMAVARSSARTWPFRPRDLRRALEASTEFTDEAGNWVLGYYPPGEAASARREIGLARLADACARLRGEPRVTAAHVAEAAELVGLTRPGEAAVPQPRDEAPPVPSPPRAPQYRPAPEHSELMDDRQVDDRQDSAPPDGGSLARVRLGSLDTLPATVFPSGAELTHPEDRAPVEREPASLKLPPTTDRSHRLGRGAVVGVERATDLIDLAFTDTIFEAAKFQRIRRRKGVRNGKPIKIYAQDLRRYRRAPLPAQLLVLVLDHTCLRDGTRDWEAALVPYLHSAYVARAAIHVVQVGAEDGDSGLRARLIRARNLLAPELAQALVRKRGSATPLAHGLELALRTMRQSLHQGRNPVARCTLVVVSDGRGNVPLDASHAGRPPESIDREGVEDALVQARLIAGLRRVRNIMLDPQPKQMVELPRELARALGAAVHVIPPVRDDADEDDE
jgi:magnesium chelatase subunit D